MAVAEFPSQAIALPRRRTRPASRPAGAPSLAWVPLVGVLLGIASLFYVAETGEVAVAGYDVQQLQNDVSAWQMRNEQLSLDLAKARALPVIETQARGRLLMVPARDPIYLKATSTDGARSVTSSRGAQQVASTLERPAQAATADPLDVVRSSLAILIPRSSPSQR
ncbi:MAG TPA: hypothetical protein VF960_04195 [Chloroflexota bacterium]